MTTTKKTYTPAVAKDIAWAQACREALEATREVRYEVELVELDETQANLQDAQAFGTVLVNGKLVNSSNGIAQENELLKMVGADWTIQSRAAEILKGLNAAHKAALAARKVAGPTPEAIAWATKCGIVEGGKAANPMSRKNYAKKCRIAKKAGLQDLNGFWEAI